MRLSPVLFLALTLPLSSCAFFRGLTSPAAMRVVLVGTDAEVEEIGSVRGMEAIVYMADLREGLNIEAGLEGADVTISGPGFAGVPLVEGGDGLYLVSSLEEPDMAYVDGGMYTIRAEANGQVYVASGPMVEALEGDSTPVLMEPNTPLTVDMPAGYEADYDQVAAVVVDDGGSETWSDYPQSTSEWINFVLGTNTPPSIDILGSAFPQRERVYAVTVAGLARVRDQASWSEDLNIVLSGFMTGSGFVIPVVTAPELP